MVQLNFTIIANTLSFLVLLYFLVKLLSKPITNLLDERAEKIQESISKTKAEEKRIQEMKEEYSKKIQTVLKEAHQIRSDARDLAEKEKKKIIDEAKKSAEYMQLKAEKNIQNEYEKAKKSLEIKIMSYAINIAEKIIRREIDEEKHKELINKSLNDIGGV